LPPAASPVQLGNPWRESIVPGTHKAKLGHSTIQLRTLGPELGQYLTGCPLVLRRIKWPLNDNEAQAVAASCSCRIAIQSQVMALIFRDKGTSGTQIEVLSGDLGIAHIGKEVLSVVARHAVRWRWSFAIMVGPPGFQPHGHADTFEAAKASVERNWQAWLAAAGLSGRGAQ
jgi:hypothetical protein